MKPLSAKYGGKWVAWNKDLTKIIASAKTFESLLHTKAVTKVVDPVFEKVPRSDRLFVGSWV